MNEIPFNVIQLKILSRKYDKFVYVDTADYKSVNILVKNGVFIKPLGGAFNKENDYKLVFCKVQKEDREQFLSSMEELANAMLVCGRQDYKAFCTEQLENAAKHFKVQAASTNN